MDDRDINDDIRGEQQRITIQVLGEFAVRLDGRRVTMPPSAQRMLAALALRPEVSDRAMLGAMLHPDLPCGRISASLRSALWRVNRVTGERLVIAGGRRIRLRDGIGIDLHAWAARARDLTVPDTRPGRTDVEAVAQDLLPGWVDPWLQRDRERWDLLRLHALERMADRFATAGDFVNALDAGLAAVSIEPYRESAHRALIKAFIAEGNDASAIAQYHRYQRLVNRELGLRPTARLQELVRGLTEP